MANIRRRQTLVNSMNSIARVSDVSFGLCHRVTVAGNSGYDGDSSTMEAQVWKANPTEKLVPFLGGVFRELDELVPFLFLSQAHQRHEVVVQRGCMDTIAFSNEADGFCLQIDVLQRDCSFGKAAALSHCNHPAVLHPRILLTKRSFDLALFVACNFRLLLRRRSFVSKLQARISIDITATNRLLENRRENFQLCQRRIESSCAHNVAGRTGSELRIRSTNLVRHLKWRNHIDVIQIRRNGRPCVYVAEQGFRVRILIGKETGHPDIKSIALSVSIDVEFSHCVLGRDLFDLSQRAVVVDADLGSFVGPGAIRALVSQPVIRAGVSPVIRCHVMQHSAAKQNQSMTISRGR